MIKKIFLDKFCPVFRINDILETAEPNVTERYLILEKVRNFLIKIFYILLYLKIKRVALLKSKSIGIAIMILIIPVFLLITLLDLILNLMKRHRVLISGFFVKITFKFKIFN